jgi:hypothetical protein
MSPGEHDSPFADKGSLPPTGDHRGAQAGAGYTSAMVSSPLARMPQQPAGPHAVQGAAPVTVCVFKLALRGLAQAVLIDVP